MKVLIWFLCIFFDALLYPVVKSLVPPIASNTDGAIFFHGLLHGVIRGLHLLLFFKLAHYLCKIWDRYKTNKESARIAAELNISIDIPSTCATLCKDSKRLNSYLCTCSEKGLITPKQQSILLNNYSPDIKKQFTKEQHAIITSTVVIIVSLIIIFAYLFF